MEKFLFVNNFRGFSATFFPLLDANFFVGENSTGKTSILSLIKLLSTPDFWFSNDFTLTNDNPTHFKDIVSISARNRQSFDIGFYLCSKGDEPKNQMLLMTFVEVEGLPILQTITYSAEDNANFRVKITQKTIRYKKIELEKASCREQLLDWLKGHKEDKTGFHLIKLPKEVFKEKLPIFFIPSLIYQHLAEKDKNRKVSLRGISPFQFPRLYKHEVTWLAPIRTKPKRTYDSYRSDYSPEGDHTPYVIKKILANQKGKTDFKNYLKEIGLDSGLFEDISVKNYGKGATNPFELDVLIHGKPLNICNVGYGVSQSLPLIVEIYIREKGSCFAIQQPEVHLHPKAQASLGDAFFEMVVKDSKTFLIETHSDFTIDRFRLNYKKQGCKNPESQILFFNRGSDGNEVFQLKIDKNGELPFDQPECYRSFFVREEMNILGL